MLFLFTQSLVVPLYVLKNVYADIEDTAHWLLKNIADAALIMSSQNSSTTFFLFRQLLLTKPLYV